MRQMLPLAKLSTMGQVTIARPGQKWNDVNNLSPSGIDSLRAMLTAMRLGGSSAGYTGDAAYDVAAKVNGALGAHTNNNKSVNGSSSAAAPQQTVTDALLDAEHHLTVKVQYRFRAL